jgi:hypothetical protein
MGEHADYEIERLIDQWENGSFRLQSRAQKKGPKCPACGRQPVLKDTAYGWRRDCCGLWGWGRFAPLVDRETHAARSYAHKVFDGLWQSGTVSRDQAYVLLAAELGLTRDDCHMKLMDKTTACRVPAAAHKIWTSLKQGKQT